MIHGGRISTNKYQQYNNIVTCIDMNILPKFLHINLGLVPINLHAHVLDSQLLKLLDVIPGLAMTPDILPLTGAGLNDIDHNPLNHRGPGALPVISFDKNLEGLFATDEYTAHR